MGIDKKGRFIAAVYGVFFGAFTSFVIWNEGANRLFAKSLDFLCAPVRLGYGLFFGDNDAYLGGYLIACVVYMTGLGYLIGHFLHRLLSKGRRRRLGP
ncbi:MAG: hypothetical protein EHM31_05330 [Candidatus Aminicenantes bacterium]|nr:MAG: hypothetical protein EHM31_05330 [Candidatus Aminicenantes bacterium]